MSSAYGNITAGQPDEVLVEVSELKRWPFPSCNLDVTLGGNRLPFRDERQSLYSVIGVFDSLQAIASNRMHPDATPEITSRGVRVESTEVLDDVKLFCRVDELGIVLTCCFDKGERSSPVSISTLEEISFALTKCYDLMMAEEFTPDKSKGSSLFGESQ